MNSLTSKKGRILSILMVVMTVILSIVNYSFVAFAQDNYFGEGAFITVQGGQSGGKNPIVAIEKPILLVGLGPIDRKGMNIDVQNGEDGIVQYYKDYTPTLNNTNTAITILNKEVTKYMNNWETRLAWYNPPEDGFRTTGTHSSHWQDAIIRGRDANADPTGGAGVYRAGLEQLAQSGNLADWKSLVTHDTIELSKSLWGYFGTLQRAGGGYKFNVAERVRAYEQSYIADLDYNNIANWTEEQSQRAAIAHLDLLMTLFSTVSGHVDDAAHEYENAINDYLQNGTQPGQVTPTCNIVIFPGIVFENNMDKTNLIMGIYDAYGYGYAVQPANSLGSNEFKSIAQITGADTVDDIYEKLYKADMWAYTANEHVQTAAKDRLGRGGYSYVVNIGFYRNAARGNLLGGLRVNANSARMPESLYLDKAAVHKGLNVIVAPPPQLNTKGTFDAEFSTIWSRANSQHFSTKSDNVNDVVQFKINMKVPDEDRAAWQAIFDKYDKFKIAFKVESTDKTGRVTRPTEDGATTSPLLPPSYFIGGTQYASGEFIDIGEAELKRYLLSGAVYMNLTDQVTKNQVINKAEHQQYGYNLQVQIKYGDDTNGGTKSSSWTGWSYDKNADGSANLQAQKRHQVSVDREPDPQRKVTYYSSPEAFAEFKEGTVQRNGNGSEETFEAMAGVPSTEHMYFTSGGSEFIMEFELEYVEREQAWRQYVDTFGNTECEFKRNDQFRSSATAGNNNGGYNGTFGENKQNSFTASFVADKNGNDAATTETDQYMYMYKAEGADSYTTEYNGHDASLPVPHDKDRDSYGPDTAKQSNNSAATTFTAVWTGTIANQTVDPKVGGIEKPSGYPCGGSPGKPGKINPETTKWNMTEYDKELAAALDWAQKYEATNKDAHGTASKIADSDGKERIWKIGNAKLAISITGETSNVKGRTYNGGSYGTKDVMSSAQGSVIHDKLGNGWNEHPGSQASGSCSDSGNPPVHKHGSWSGFKETTTSKVPDLKYKIVVTFDNGTLQAHELCGPCCQHELPQIFDNWVQKYEYDYMRMNAVRVYKIHRSQVNDMEEITLVDYKGDEDTGQDEFHMEWMHGAKAGRHENITAAEQSDRKNGTETIVAAISQGDPNIFYNIGNMQPQYGHSSGSGKVADRPGMAGRMRCTFQVQQTDYVYMEEMTRRGNLGYAQAYNCTSGSRSNKCDGLCGTIDAENPEPVQGRGHETEWANGILYDRGYRNYTGYIAEEQYWMTDIYGNEGMAEKAGKGRKKTGYDGTYLDDKDVLTEEYARFKYRRNSDNTLYIVSDMLLLQTSSGDQPAMYYVTPPQTQTLQKWYEYDDADRKAHASKNVPLRGTLMKSDVETMYHRNKNAVVNWGANNIGQDGDVNVGSYTGEYQQPANKFSTAGKTKEFTTVFDNTNGIYKLNDLDAACPHPLQWVDKFYGPGGGDSANQDNKDYGANKAAFKKKYVGRNAGGYEQYSSSVVPGSVLYQVVEPYIDEVDTYHYKSTPNRCYQDTVLANPDNYSDDYNGQKRMVRPRGLRIFTDELIQNPINTNKEYETGDAFQDYIMILDWDKSASFVHEFEPAPVYALDLDDGKTVDGYTLEAPYSREHEKINDIVVHTPVSVEDATLMHSDPTHDNWGGDDYEWEEDFSKDSRTANELAGAKDLTEKLDELNVCPRDPELCDFRVLNCSFDEDKVVANFDFEPTYTDKDGKKREGVIYQNGRTYVVNTVNGNTYALPDGFNVNVMKKVGDDYKPHDILGKAFDDDDIAYIYNKFDPATGQSTPVKSYTQIFGDVYGQYLKCYGTRWSIPLGDLTGGHSAQTKLAVEMNFYKPNTSQTGSMIVSFGRYAFFIPSDAVTAGWNTGNGMAKEVKNTNFVRQTMRLKLIIDFGNANNNEVYINEQKVTNYSLGKIDDIKNSIGDNLNIGSWNNDNQYPASFYIDNLKITSLAGKRQHDDSCYTDVIQHSNTIQYTCQIKKNFEYKAENRGEPEEYMIPQSGKYKIEAFGAQGGGSAELAQTSHGGYGGYSYGFRHFNKGDKVLVYVGGQGDVSANGTGETYGWTLTSGCGNYKNFCDAADEWVDGLSYNNSVTGKEEHTNWRGPVIWSKDVPAGFTCGNHSVSIATVTSTGAMLSKLGGTAQAGDARDFGYTGGVQVYTAPVDGSYTLEAWGASGGGHTASMTGQGGYTKGTVDLKAGQKLYIYVGQQGQYIRGTGEDTAHTGTKPAPATFNGGGDGGTTMGNWGYHIGGAGGGATDFRLVNGDWNNGASLQSRILVAGGGGGCGCASNHNAGNGGGLTGAGTRNATGTYAGAATSGGSQHAGGTGVGKYTERRSGGFGVGASAAQCAAGGGGGYYGGGSEYTAGGAGGSSFVTGYAGCDTTFRSKQGNLNFTNVVMQQGGNVGNGRARVTCNTTAAAYKDVSSAGWNGGGLAGKGGSGGGGATDIRVLKYGGVYTVGTGLYVSKETGMTYGPYIEAGKGHYQADIYGKNLDKATYDVYSNTQTNGKPTTWNITEYRVTPTHATVYFTLDRELAAGNTSGLEVRTVGGGATVDKMYISRLEDRIIVGGGGGGADDTYGTTVGGLNDGSGGGGGGLTAGNGYVDGKPTVPGQALTTKLQSTVDGLKDANGAWKAIQGVYASGCGLGAGQTFGYSLGVGESVSYTTDAGGAGGGYYGGYVTNHGNGGGGGGSGYIAGLKTSGTVSSANPGNGLATIHFIDHEKSTDTPVSGTNKLMATYDYTGNVQTFTAPTSGNYLFELWGAAGGDARVVNTATVVANSGGAGGFASGSKYLKAGQSVQIRVGGRGEDAPTGSKSYGKGGYNGGGNGGTELSGESYPENGAGGGGATDVRTGPNATDRFIVAGGGGGAGSHLSGAVAATPFGIPGLVTKSEGGKTWARVVYQDISKNTNYFMSKEEGAFTNQPGKYSCLGRLDQFKNTSGNFEFMLEYPDATGALAGKKNIWTQTSNPWTEQKSDGSGQNAAGYNKISGEMSGSYGAGMEYNCSSALLDGTVNHGNWWLCVGIMNHSYAPTNTASKPYTMPGPCIAGVGSQGVSQCALWVRIDNVNGAMDMTGGSSATATPENREKLGGAGGGSVGKTTNTYGAGGTQTSGFDTTGRGQDGYSHNGGKNLGSTGGAGGGWYGGTTKETPNSIAFGGPGGSSYVGDVNEQNTVPGDLEMPAPNGGTETGHRGNGYVKVYMQDNSSTGEHTPECEFIQSENNVHIHGRDCISDDSIVLRQALNAEYTGDHTLLKKLLGETVYNKLRTTKTMYTMRDWYAHDRQGTTFTDCTPTFYGNGGFRLTDFGANPHFGMGNVNIEAGAVDKITVNGTVTGNPTRQLDFYFRKAGSDTWEGPVVGKYEGDKAVINVGNDNRWQGNITGISFDPIANNTPGGQFDLRSIEFEGAGTAVSNIETTKVLYKLDNFSNTIGGKFGIVQDGTTNVAFNNGRLVASPITTSWEFKVPVTFEDLSKVKAVRLVFQNTTKSTAVYVSKDRTNAGTSRAGVAIQANTSTDQTAVIPIDNWTGRTDNVWFDFAYGGDNTGQVLIKSIEFIGYGTPGKGTIVDRSVTKDFGYTGGVQTFKAPYTGAYTLEVWGASGGGVQDTTKSSHAGMGGYTKAKVNVNAGQTLYIYCGGNGVLSTGYGTGGGYNGGGHGGNNGYGGGGMTHISTTANLASAGVSQSTVSGGTGSKTFNYTGGIQTFTVPETGTYTLEVWGAAGGGWGSHDPADGGYSSGQVKLTKGQTLYICVGGSGYDLSQNHGHETGYNGGVSYSSGGSGGATHIATANGVLSSLNTLRSSVLIVAGGGGSNGYWGGVGRGGGLEGEGGADTHNNTTYATYDLGGKQNSSGSVGTPGGFGYGGVGYNRGGCGGGGWYGGSGAGKNGTNYYSGGGGGSGYIGGVTNGVTVVGGGASSGDGWAKITWNIQNTVLTPTASWNSAGTLAIAGGGGGADNSFDNMPVGSTDDGSGGSGGGNTGENARVGGSYSTGTGATQTTGYARGVGQSATAGGDTGGGGAGWFGGKATLHNNGGAGGGSGWTSGTLLDQRQDANWGNGKAKITYSEQQYSAPSIVTHVPTALGIKSTPMLGLDGTEQGVLNAINQIRQYAGEIPDPVDGEFNPIFDCDRLYNTHQCDERCNDAVRVLKCTEPHHSGMHYSSVAEAKEHGHDFCYVACGDDEKHKKNKHEIEYDNGKLVKQEIYINTDEYFDIYFPNIGDFQDTELHGIGNTVSERGIGYEERMDTSMWTREKYVKFTVDTLFYREETQKWEQYNAGDWIELPVKGHSYPYYHFYCTLNNSEQAAASATFEVDAINARDSVGKYNYKNYGYDRYDGTKFKYDTDYDFKKVPNTNHGMEDYIYQNYGVYKNEKETVPELENKSVYKTASDHTNDNDNRAEQTNKERSRNLKSYHGATKTYMYDVVGRVGNLFISDTGDLRFANMFKLPNQTGGWLIDGIVRDVWWNIQNYYLSWHYDNSDLARDVRNRLVDRDHSMYNLWATQKWVGASDTEPSNHDGHAIELPLGSASSKNHNPIQLEEDMLKLGYPVHFEVTSTGNYGGSQNMIQVKPYFYALAINDDTLPNGKTITAGSMFPVDVHMKTDDKFETINFFGAVDNTLTWEGDEDNEGFKDKVYDYNLDLEWSREYARRNYVGVSEKSIEQQITEKLRDTFVDIDPETGIEEKLLIPAGDHYSLGNAQILRANGRARTFIGSNRTLYELETFNGDCDTNFENKFNSIMYNYRAQRWHLKMGVPSSAVFTPYLDGKHLAPGDTIKYGGNEILAYEMIKEGGNYAIVMTANIKVLGDVWELYYGQDVDKDRQLAATDDEWSNGHVMIDDRRYDFNYLGEHDKNGNPIPSEFRVVLAVYGTHNPDLSSESDYDIIGTH